jgi:hypothetical protein
MHAVEARLRHEPIELSDDEHVRQGDTRKVVPRDTAIPMKLPSMGASMLAAEFVRRHRHCDCHEGPIGRRKLVSAMAEGAVPAESLEAAE